MAEDAGAARLGSARLGSARLGSARLGNHRTAAGSVEHPQKPSTSEAVNRMVLVLLRTSRLPKGPTRCRSALTPDAPSSSGRHPCRRAKCPGPSLRGLPARPGRRPANEHPAEGPRSLKRAGGPRAPWGLRPLAGWEARAGKTPLLSRSEAQPRPHSRPDSFTAVRSDSVVNPAGNRRPDTLPGKRAASCLSGDRVAHRMIANIIYLLCDLLD